MKKIGLSILMLLMLFSLVSCGGTNGNQGNPSDSAGSSSQAHESNKDSVQAYESSTAKNDTDIGLRTIKIDSSAFEELSEDQQKVIEYFNDDYLSVPDYDFLRRYPKILQDAELSVWGTITDVISWNTYFRSRYPSFETGGNSRPAKSSSATPRCGRKYDRHGLLVRIQTVSMAAEPLTLPLDLGPTV